MMEISNINRENILYIYMVSNTPSYLYRHLREDNSTRALAQHNSTDDLIKYIKHVDATEERTPQQVAMAYAAVIALTFQDVNEVKLRIRDLNIENLVWADRLLKMWRERALPSSVYTIRGRPRRYIREASKGSDSHYEIQPGAKPLAGPLKGDDSSSQSILKEVE